MDVGKVLTDCPSANIRRIQKSISFILFTYSKLCFLSLLFKQVSCFLCSYFMWRNCSVEARKHRQICIFKKWTDSSDHVSVWLRAAHWHRFQHHRKLTYNQQQAVNVKVNNNLRSLASCKVTLQWPCSDLVLCQAAWQAERFWLNVFLVCMTSNSCYICWCTAVTHVISKPPILPNPFRLGRLDLPQKYEFDILLFSHYKQFKCIQTIETKGSRY